MCKPPNLCSVCRRPFKPKQTWMDKCVVCWAKEQGFDNPPKTCSECGEEFKPALDWFEECPACYDAKFKQPIKLVVIDRYGGWAEIWEGIEEWEPDDMLNAIQWIKDNLVEELE